MFLKKLLCWAVFGFCISCTFLDKDSDPSIDSTGNTIAYYYNRSLDNTLSPEEQRQAIDRSLHLVNTQGPHPIYGMILYQKCRLSYGFREYDSLLLYDKFLAKHAKHTKDVQTLARQHYLMGNFFEKVVVPDSAFNRYNLSKNYHLELKDSSGVGRNLLRMGIIQKDKSDFFGSKETLTEALPFLKVQKNDRELAQVYNLLATDHRKLFNFEEAVKYFELAIEKAGPIEEKLGFENNLAASYIDDEKYRDAIKILQRIILDSSLEKTSAQYARVLDNLAYAQWLSGKEKNEEPFLSALRIRKTAKDNRGLIASYTHLGEFQSKENPKEAKAYLDTVIRLSKTIKMPKAEADALKFMMPLQPNSIELYKRYIFLQDSLHAQELNVKTQFAHYKYDNQVTLEKSLRLEKENAEKALEVTRQRNQKIVSFFGLALLLLTLGFVVYYLKQRTRRLAQENKTAKLEATLETEAEMSRRLHDDFGAGLNQVMLMVQSDTETSKILDKLEQLYGQSRNFSREINEVDTGTHFKEEFLEMLRFRTPENAKLYLSGNGEIDWDGLTPLLKTVLYKVLQELMINMDRHSKASLVTIGFEDSSKMLVVDYLDNGAGATKKELQSKNGLRNTEKRIQAIGGTITFDSVKGQGFKAHIQIPK
jgi:Signal transduction histidine kinase